MTLGGEVSPSGPWFAHLSNKGIGPRDPKASRSSEILGFYLTVIKETGMEAVSGPLLPQRVGHGGETVLPRAGRDAGKEASRPLLLRI